MGYQGLNGKSLATLASAAKYGLLEGRGDENRVSDLAVRIIAHPPGSPDRMLAMIEAAGKPELFTELDQRFGGGKGSDQAIKAYLMTQKFIPPAANLAIRSYRETKRFLEEEGMINPADFSRRKTEIESVPEFIAPREDRIPAPLVSAPSADKRESVFRVGLSDDRLDVSAALFDAEAVDKLIRALEANKALLPQRPVTSIDARERD